MESVSAPALVAPELGLIEAASAIYKSNMGNIIWQLSDRQCRFHLATMLQSGLDVRKVITHRIKAADYAQGFALMKQGSCGKVVLDWGR